MNKRNVRLVETAVLMAVASLLLAVGYISPFVTAAAADGSRASARSGSDGGQAVGEVLVDGRVVLRMRTSAGGYTPYERAMKVAQRLDSALSGGVRPADIYTSPWEGEAVVLAGNALLVTADAQHAYLNNTTPLGLANDWATNLAGALGGHHGGRVQYNPHGNDNNRRGSGR